jgi:hypothetical protein
MEATSARDHSGHEQEGSSDQTVTGNNIEPSEMLRLGRLTRIGVRSRHKSFPQDRSGIVSHLRSSRKLEQ